MEVNSYITFSFLLSISFFIVFLLRSLRVLPPFLPLLPHFFLLPLPSCTVWPLLPHFFPPFSVPTFPLFFFPTLFDSFRYPSQPRSTLEPIYLVDSFVHWSLYTMSFLILEYLLDSRTHSWLLK